MTHPKFDKRIKAQDCFQFILLLLFPFVDCSVHRASSLNLIASSSPTGSSGGSRRLQLCLPPSNTIRYSSSLRYGSSVVASSVSPQPSSPSGSSSSSTNWTFAGKAQRKRNGFGNPIPASFRRSLTWRSVFERLRANRDAVPPGHSTWHPG